MSEAKKLMDDFKSILARIENSHGVMMAIEKSYEATFPVRGTNPRGHDAHLMAVDGGRVQAGELMWRLRAGIDTFIQSPTTNGHPGYDPAIMWLVEEVFEDVCNIFPDAVRGTGKKSPVAVIVERVLKYVVVSGNSTKRKEWRGRDLLEAMHKRKAARTERTPPPIVNMTTPL